ncbi:cytochrome d ubiquinol oxidase subunit II [Tenacibaculum sp. M341]|uniref:cytochrome d ubiquinol oxidase subunit II n=1 Tax=Tenacibaculum sp. M341 TaxID=2530339 RepID=UPI001045385C|nr:cytochrome d ubiquinol oxidase subunit II [Tenacibaculum sp. M341]TCI84887.1 cytochrome d ubiquinol oxidase subunit II [Tenacibaculum sp. M341]
MISVVLFFLTFSLLLYVLLGGADFGAGILELFSSKENQDITKKTIYRVMGPVWEANHIWVIILIVILWVAFPTYYKIMVTYLHIPITLMLLGITLRGVAFVFRHYDAFEDKSQHVYNWLFRVSSFITPIFLGMIFGAMVSGNIILKDDVSTMSFAQVFINPWLNIFSVLVGCFFASLCTFLSAVLLIGEADEEGYPVYVRKATIATVVVVVFGFIVISYGFLSDSYFVKGILNNTLSILLIVLSALCLLPLWFFIRKGNRINSRVFAGLQVILIIAVAIVPHFPNLLIVKESTLSILENKAPDAVIRVLGISLIIGGAIILPGLFHLLKSFKLIKILEKN